MSHPQERRIGRRSAIIGWMRGRLGVALLVVVCGAMCGCGSCSKDSDEKDEQAEQREQEDDGAEASGKEDEQPREAFGIPFPPQVLHVRDEGVKVRVQTELSLDELAEFFKGRLTDYEILDAGHELRVVGLREYMAQVYAYRYADVTQVVYVAPGGHRGGGASAEKGDDSNKEGSSSGRADGDETRTQRQATRAKPRAGSKPIAQRKKGEPVRDRNADGELIAPGARWGEAYTPPEGSPLHKKRHESNFGRPYGEWVEQ
ncbi:MAG: hypothetical protein ACOCV2_14925 [Persicimonas sp.]